MSRENKRARGGGKFLDFLLSVFVTGEPPLFLLLVRRDYYSVLILPCHTFLLLLLLHLTASLTVSIFCSPTFLRSHPFLVIDFYFSFFFILWFCRRLATDSRTNRPPWLTIPSSGSSPLEPNPEPSECTFIRIYFFSPFFPFFFLIFYLTPDPQWKGS